MDAAFIALTIITLVGALWAVTLRNLVRGVLSLVLFFLGIAGFFFYLRADFVGWVQLLIYVGAVAILMLFAIMLTRNITGDMEDESVFSARWVSGIIIATAVGAVLWAAISRNPSLPATPQANAVSTSLEIGRKMMTDWVIPFEVVSLLLTAAMVGAIVIAMEKIKEEE
ncbi:MAG: NADH-quinone oxidoreductase subunit J [Verrucomicrobia bacterium]|nr:NADH-quinone oxidoreductase subunit J [Verrucomicrobiota bacterium]